MSAVNETLIRDIVAEVLGRLGGGSVSNAPTSTPASAVSSCGCNGKRNSTPSPALRGKFGVFQDAAEVLGPLGARAVSSQMPWWRMPTARRFFSANRLGEKPVPLQGFNCGASGGANTHNPYSVPAKVEPPRVAPRIEQTNVFTGARVNSSLAGAFTERAGHTGKSEVVENRFPACIKRNVVDVKGGFLPFLRQAAILATVCGASDGLLPQFRGHRYGVTRRVRRLAVCASAAVRGGQQAQRVLGLRAALTRSAFSPGPVYPAAQEAASEGPSGIEIWPGQPVVPSRIERAFAYSQVLFCPKLTHRRVLSKPTLIGNL